MILIENQRLVTSHNLDLTREVREIELKLIEIEGKEANIVKRIPKFRYKIKMSRKYPNLLALYTFNWNSQGRYVKEKEFYTKEKELVKGFPLVYVPNSIEQLILSLYEKDE